MTRHQETPPPPVLEELDKLSGDVKTVADAIAALEPDMDDPIVAARVRARLHGAATEKRSRTS